MLRIVCGIVLRIVCGIVLRIVCGIVQGLTYLESFWIEKYGVLGEGGMNRRS